MSNNQKHVRLGELLLAADVLSSDYIKEALTIYESQGLPLGKVLVISGYLNDTQLKYALDLQYMVNDHLLEFDKAVEVMKLCHGERKSLAEAFVKASVVRPEDNETNKLGQLLLIAEIIDTEKLEECLVTNESTALPLGHILCHRGLVSQPLVNKALAVQNLIRTGHIKREAGLASLQAAHARELELCKLECNSSFVRRPLKNTPRLGELLSLCNICNDAQISEILIDSISQHTTFGAAILKKSNLTEEMIEKAVELQEMMDRNTLDKDQAKNALTNIILKGYTAVRAVSEANAYKMVPNQAVPLIDLLKASGVIKNEDISREIQECLSVNYNQVRQVVNMLIEEGTISDTILFSCLRLVDLLQRDFVTYEKAIVALEFSHRSGKDIEYTLYMTGVFERSRLREKDYE